MLITYNSIDQITITIEYLTSITRSLRRERAATIRHEPVITMSLSALVDGRALANIVRQSSANPYMRVEVPVWPLARRVRGSAIRAGNTPTGLSPGQMQQLCLVHSGGTLGQEVKPTSISTSVVTIPAPQWLVDSQLYDIAPMVAGRLANGIKAESIGDRLNRVDLSVQLDQYSTLLATARPQSIMGTNLLSAPLVDGGVISTSESFLSERELKHGKLSTIIPRSRLPRRVVSGSQSVPAMEFGRILSTFVGAMGRNGNVWVPIPGFDLDISRGVAKLGPGQSVTALQDMAVAWSGGCQWLRPQMSNLSPMSVTGEYRVNFPVGNYRSAHVCMRGRYNSDQLTISIANGRADAAVEFLERQ